MTVQLSFLLISEEGLDIRHLWQILEWHFFLLKHEKQPSKNVQWDGLLMFVTLIAQLSAQ